MTKKEMAQLIEDLEARVQFLRGQVRDVCETIQEKNRKIRQLESRLKNGDGRIRAFSL